jgi:alpha-N-arabinofuranosidase
VNGYGDTRSTPYLFAHSTEFAGLYSAAKGDSGDHRFYNNLFVGPCDLHAMDESALPCFAAGNVFANGAQASKFDTHAPGTSSLDTGVKLTREPDGWYLELIVDKEWSNEAKRELVTTALLGRTKVSSCLYENPDGTPLRINTDYFGRKRDEQNPFPGPFELSEGGQKKLKVWPSSEAD